jgi:hypothetical protein
MEAMLSRDANLGLSEQQYFERLYSNVTFPPQEFCTVDKSYSRCPRLPGCRGLPRPVALAIFVGVTKNLES